MLLDAGFCLTIQCYRDISLMLSSLFFCKVLYVCDLRICCACVLVITSNIFITLRGVIRHILSIYPDDEGQSICCHPLSMAKNTAAWVTWHMSPAVLSRMTANPHNRTSSESHIPTNTLPFPYF